MNRLLFLSAFLPISTLTLISHGDVSAEALDRVSMLYSSQVMFSRGVPVVTILLMEGRDSVVFSTGRGGTVRTGADGSGELRTSEGLWTATAVGTKPARIAWRSIVDEIPYSEKEKRDEVERLWAGRGFKVRTFTVGSVFGMAGRVYDNRSYLVTVATDGDVDRDHSISLSSELFKKYGVRIGIYPEVMERPSGTIELRNPAGKVAASGEGLVSLTGAGGGPVLVKKVEHGIGYPWHAFEDRSYSSEVLLVLDRTGRIAVVNSLPLPELLRGLVPSEIFAKAHPQALRAQAVSARSEILAKIGHRHPGNPYLLCAEQHCQVYSGLAKEFPETTRAVMETEGEVLVSSGGRIIGAVYSSNCGGHTEDNDVVWEQEPDPALRGKPDVPEGSDLYRKWKGPLKGEKLRAWLDAKPDTWCRKSSYASPASFRWQKTIKASDMDALVNRKYKIGKVRDVRIIDRGASGRVTGVKIVGENGTAHVGREFAVRQIFNGLKSGMFTLSIKRDAKGRPVRFLFTGGGWGHGVGMCQTGAIGMAEAGLDYRLILMHYFSGAQIAKVY